MGRISVSASLVILAGILSACNGNDSGNNSSAAAPREIVIGVSPFQDTILPKFGAQKGWYEAEGLKVRFVTLGWTEINEALSAPSGRGVDIAINNECGVISAHARNPEIVYYYGVNPFDNGFALIVRPDGKLRPLSDFLQQGLSRPEAVKAAAAQLKGRTVITTSNTDMEQGVAAAARLAGLSLGQDVKIINLPPEEGLAAFLSGQGDAFIGGVPQRFAAVRRGNRELLTGVDLGPAPINGFVTTKAFAQAYPDVLPKILKVWFKTVQYTNSHQDEVAASVSQMLKADGGVDLRPEDFKANWNKIETFIASPDEARQQIISPTGKNYWRRRWDDCNTYFSTIARTIPKAVPPEGVFLMESVQGKVEAAYRSN